MDLFGRRARREIDNPTTVLARRTAQRDYHQGQAQTFRNAALIVARKFTDNHTLGWYEAGRLAEQVDGYQNLLTRHARLLRATARHRAELAQYRQDLAARDEQIRVLRAALAAHGEPDDDRASQPAVPLPADMEMARRNRLLQEQNAALQERLDAYQAREMAADWRFADQANAAPVIQPAA